VRASRRAARRKGFSRWREKVPAGAPLKQKSMNNGATPADSHRNLKILPLQKEKIVLEMEFLDINLTKDSSLLFHAIHSTGGILRKARLYSGFKIHTKKPRNMKNSSLFVNSIW
jgi:hypothetical protein